MQEKNPNFSAAEQIFLFWPQKTHRPQRYNHLQIKKLH